MIISKLYSNDIKEIEYDQLDDRIKNVLSIGKDKIRKIESIDNSKEIIIHYSDTFYNAKIFFIMNEDSLLVNKNQLQQFVDFSKIKKIDFDNQTLIKEINKKKSGVRDVHFNDYLSGNYKDIELNRKNIYFEITINQYDIVSSKLLGSEMNFIPLSEFKYDNNLITVFTFRSKRCGFKLENHILIQRYRQILFDINENLLLSNEIISPISLLTE